MRRDLIWILLAVLLLPQAASAREEKRDSLVRLISADMARLVEVDGTEYRKIVGNAVFLHNDTYLYCDSAYWNVRGEYIDAIGHVRIEQENTVLTGDSIKYVIPENTARFRGHLVELIDRDSNVLRTNHLDYNTRDSIAFFYRGGAMKDSDGNLIESLTGRYQARIEKFDFIGDVEMFSDSLFFTCDTLYYDTQSDVADFYGSTKGWYGSNCIYSGNGKYVRPQEKFYFHRDVHILTEDYELWCDSLYYDRNTEFSHLLGNVQLLDTVDNALALAGDLRFWNEPRRAELYRDPAVVLITGSDGEERDSVFMASDTLIYYTRRMYELDSALVAAARERYDAAMVDPLAALRKKDRGTGTVSAGAASAGAAAEDTVEAAQADTLMPPPPPDTTTVSFVEAYHNVRIFKSDIQVLCDSLLFTSIDSIARLFTDPVIWYEIRNQITADSMQFLLRNQALDRGYLFSNAFVISEEEPDKYYHQIKSPEMIGYFHDNQVSRFDALGGVNALFFVAEDSVITTMNQKECRLMTGRLKDGQVQRILYTEKIKSDAYPIEGLTEDKARLRDFNWMPQLRPVTRYDVTSRPVHPSGRQEMTPSPWFPAFRYAGKYFEGYMEGIIAEIDSRKPIIWVERE